MLKVYLDNCCYSRPFDDLSQKKIKEEAVAKMYIQSLIKFKSLELYSSFMLLYEINQNPYEKNREHILHFVNEFSSYYLSESKKDEVKSISEKIMETGIKYKDSVHLACSIYLKCDYFITTDDRVMKYSTDEIEIINPIIFAEKWRNME